MEARPQTETVGRLRLPDPVRLYGILVSTVLFSYKPKATQYLVYKVESSSPVDTFTVQLYLNDDRSGAARAGTRHAPRSPAELFSQIVARTAEQCEATHCKHVSCYMNGTWLCLWPVRAAPARGTSVGNRAHNRPVFRKGVGRDAARPREQTDGDAVVCRTPTSRTHVHCSRCWSQQN